MKERLAGIILMLVIVPLAILGYFIIVFVGLFGSTRRVRAGVRALDHFVNASVFNGYAWESVSSHAWRRRQTKRWARAVIAITDIFDKDHCEKASRRELPIVQQVFRRKLYRQTVGKKTPAAQPERKENAGS